MSDRDVLARLNVSNEVLDERAAQEAKWGEQNHPDGTMAALQAMAEQARAACDRHHSDGTGTWAHILAEEFWEAMAEEDPAKLRTELIQVAAVASAWVEAIDRRLAADIISTEEPTA